MLGLSVLEVQLLLDIFAVGLMLPLVPFIARDLGATPTTIGLIQTCYGFAQLVGGTLWGRYSDEHGRKSVILVSLVGAGVSYLCMGLSVSLWMLAASRVTIGLCKQSITVAQAYITDTSSPRERQARLGRLSMCVGFGYSVGPYVGAVLSKQLAGLPDGEVEAVGQERHVFWKPALLAFLVYALDALLVIAFLEEPRSRAKGKGGEGKPTTTAAESNSKEENEKKRSKKGKGGGFWADLSSVMASAQLRPLFVIAFLLDFGYLTFRDSFSIFLMNRFGLDTRGTGAVLSYIGVLTVFSQGVVVKWVAARWHETRLLVATLAALTVLYALLASTTSPVALFILLTPYDIAGSVAKTASVSLVTKQAHDDDVGLLLGLKASLSSVSRIVCPTLGGLLVSYSDVFPAVFAAFLSLVLLLYLYWQYGLGLPLNYGDDDDGKKKKKKL